MYPKIDIRLGTPLKVDLVYEIAGKLYISKNISAFLAGMEERAFVAIRIADDSDRKQFYTFVNSSDLVIKYIHGGKAFAFSAQVTNKTEFPTPLVYVSYPEEVETISLRKEPRCACSLPAEIICGGYHFNAVTVDLSRSGGKFIVQANEEEARASLTAGLSIDVFLQLPGVEGEHRCECSISQASIEPNHCTIGVAFRTLPALTEHQIAELLTQLFPSGLDSPTL